MPGREEIFLNNRYYHIFNKTVGSQRIFEDSYNCKSFLRRITYYRSSITSVSLSTADKLPSKTNDRIWRLVGLKKYFKIDLIAYCLMPTHYHLLLRQSQEKGISQFISDTINSFTRHINVKHQRKGPIFLTKFKAVRIHNREQLMHVSRYIHLNPYSSTIVHRIQDLIKYPWSSYYQYVTGSKGIINTEFLMNKFENNFFLYQRFVEDQAEYQKTLEMAKHAEKWI